MDSQDVEAAAGLPEESPEADADEVSPSRSRSALLFARDILFILLAAIVISFLIKTFLVRAFYIPSESMENTLMVNDRVLVNELEPALMPVHRGDVIVFSDPGSWLPPTTVTPETGATAAINGTLRFIGLLPEGGDNHLIKRVIGLPGDHIACCTADGRMTVNGIPIDEPYVHLPAGVTKASADPFEVKVPAGELWVMGDNRNNSEDSRYHQSLPTKGFVPMKDVVGKAFVITWPIDRWTWLGNYPLTFDGVNSGASESTAGSH